MNTVKHNVCSQRGATAPENNKSTVHQISIQRVYVQVTEAYLECTEENRDERLYYLLTQHPGRTLIFTNAISMVRRLAAVLRLLQLPVTAMHSSMQQRQRLKALDRFRKSDSAIMIATDVAARGLDIPVILTICLSMTHIDRLLTFSS